MNRKYDVRSHQTLETIAALKKDGIKKLSVLLRHSERHFSKDPQKDPFMGLTQTGKTIAFDFGARLETSDKPALYASFISRCVETAYLIDKGFTKQHGLQLAHTTIDKGLSPFYLINIQQTGKQVQKMGSTAFLRQWFDNKIDPSVIMPPKETCDRMCQYMIRRVQDLDDGQIALCVSHDWNLFPVKEFKFNLPHETAGDVGYLEGLIFFEDKGQYYVTCHQAGPVLLP